MESHLVEFERRTRRLYDVQKQRSDWVPVDEVVVRAHRVVNNYNNTNSDFALSLNAFDADNKIKNADFMKNSIEHAERRVKKLMGELEHAEKQNAGILQTLVRTQESSRTLQ